MCVRIVPVVVVWASACRVLVGDQAGVRLRDGGHEGRAGFGSGLTGLTALVWCHHGLVCKGGRGSWVTGLSAWGLSGSR